MKFDLKNRHFMKLFYYSTEKVDFTENSFLSKKAKKEKLTLYSVENEKFGLTKKIFRQINYLSSNFFSKNVTFTIFAKYV